MLHIRILRHYGTTETVLYQIVHMHLQLFAARIIVVKKMATQLQKAKCILWFNRTKYGKQGQRRYLTECGVKQLSKPSIFCI
jgi:hypothetical protein